MSPSTPHFRRSALIGHLIEYHQVEKAALAAALRHVAAAVFLVDSAGCASFMTEMGKALVGEGKILRHIQGSLWATNAKANSLLQDSLAAAGRDRAAAGGRGAAILLSETQAEPWMAHVVPLTCNARQRARTIYPAVAAVFVRKAVFNVDSPLEILTEIYKLTAMELRVLRGVIEIGGTPAIANALGISETTVKTHLKGLFDKTGARRQIDLVKFVAAYANPFAI